MKNAVKKYLEEQIKTDSALAEKYDGAKIDDCIKHIVECARKELGGNNGAIEDAVVYHWAREFFLEAETSVATEKKTAVVKKAAVEKTANEIQNTDGQMTLFEV